MKRGFDYASVKPLFNDLMQRGFSPVHAAAIAGNFAHESGPRGRIDYGINEIKPTVKGSRGGYGAAQWTGPRRVGLEQFAKQNGLNVADRETQMKYFDKERTGSEAGAFNRLQKTGDVNSATKAFMQGYERPRASTANLAGRQQHAQAILREYQQGAYNDKSPVQMAEKAAPAPVKVAQAELPKGSVLNQINPKDPSGPLLSQGGQAPQQMAQLNPNDMGRGIPASNMQTPGLNPKLEQPAPQMMAQADAPIPPSRPSGLGAETTNAPLPPIRPDNIAPPAPVQVAQQPSPVVQQMAMRSQPQPQLHEPMAGPTGGMEGFASGMGGAEQPAMSPVVAMNDPFGGGGDLGSLFGNAFEPGQEFMTADAGPDFGGGMDFGGGGFDLGSLFG